MSAEKQRKHYNREEKVKILREHLERKRPVSELCEAYGIDQGQFSQWKKTFFEGGAQVFANRGKRGRDESAFEHKTQELERELARMQLVVAYPPKQVHPEVS